MGKPVALEQERTMVKHSSTILHVLRVRRALSTSSSYQRAGNRHRRLDPSTGFVLRSRWSETKLRDGQPVSLGLMQELSIKLIPPFSEQARGSLLRRFAGLRWCACKQRL